MDQVQHKEAVIEHENQYFRVYSKDVDFGAFVKKYFVTQHGEKSGVLIVDEKKNAVLLGRQYRLLINRQAWEVPGGRIEEGEKASESAIRECEEETGFLPLNIKPLIHYLQGLDTIDAGLHLFYTTEYKKVREFEPNPQEVNEVKWFSIDKVFEMIKSGEICDHFTMIAMLYYQFLKQ